MADVQVMVRAKKAGGGKKSAAMEATGTESAVVADTGDTNTEILNQEDPQQAGGSGLQGRSSGSDTMSHTDTDSSLEKTRRKLAKSGRKRKVVSLMTDGEEDGDKDGEKSSSEEASKKKEKSSGKKGKGSAKKDSKERREREKRREKEAKEEEDRSLNFIRFLKTLS